jgi:hypothetical protein
LRDSANVFNDSSIEEPMAIEQTPTEPDLRAPRRRRRELNSLLWLCGWGGFTALALTALAIASQTETAGVRLRHIFPMNESSAIARMPPRVAQLETETQRLAAQVRALTTDRDRLAGRIALLESSIDDMTGAIKKQAAATAVALAAKVPPPTLGAPATAPPAPSNPPGTNVTIAATETLASAAPPAPKADRALPQVVPLPPARVATVSITGPDPPATRQDNFGLDLGGGATIDAVRQRWSTVKANFGPLLGGMHPLAAHDQRPGATGYRLVVGPLPNSAAASSLCVHFSAARTACRAVKFDGEQIAEQ